MRLPVATDTSQAAPLSLTASLSMPTLTRIGRSGRVGTGDLPDCALRLLRYRGNDPCPKQTRLENSRETKLGTLFATYGEFRPTEGRHGKAGDMTNTGTGRSTAISST